MSEQPDGKPPFSEPQHADFERLQALVQTRIDLPAQLQDFDLLALLGQVADQQSVSYTAISRAVAYHQVKDPKELQERMAEVMRTSLLWVEGFLMGAFFERERE